MVFLACMAGPQCVACDINDSTKCTSCNHGHSGVNCEIGMQLHTIVSYSFNDTNSTCMFLSGCNEECYACEINDATICTKCPGGQSGANCGTGMYLHFA